jgi:hypothetical protein
LIQLDIHCFIVTVLKRNLLLLLIPVGILLLFLIAA